MMLMVSHRGGGGKEGERRGKKGEEVGKGGGFKFLTGCIRITWYILCPKTKIKPKNNARGRISQTMLNSYAF